MPGPPAITAITARRSGWATRRRTRAGCWPMRPYLSALCTSTVSTWYRWRVSTWAITAVSLMIGSMLSVSRVCPCLYSSTKRRTKAARSTFSGVARSRRASPSTLSTMPLVRWHCWRMLCSSRRSLSLKPVPSSSSGTA
ncbi:hypothetical protein G6F60_014950 [Rhizopus arrhizus]|nr:hypothetical protein G6F60_014950 [Rhizopus arrhizus]